MKWLTGSVAATFVPALLILGCCAARAMDNLTIAGIYAADRGLCRLSVDQNLVDGALAGAIIEHDITPSQAKKAAAYIALSIINELEDSGRVSDYCRGRTKK